ncbi:Lysine-specific histone demethylase 1-like 1 [Hondaea fermentalgiana]|uniref:Lysine-specific histone demethylase 1-like 1 n=1 Tax=Hondaea fermentalgiana TaxID=2315210 RepID=A0A2R5GQS3_9STRA|nr:Lysine-specific histone demethylase 1-like 1 [Hondaea fermentalgiana]|eukprot:GBG33200.1 Lysine-specific histone demethylase 1-like 1 [Hondaea fermentalgiana]
MMSGIVGALPADPPLSKTKTDTENSSCTKKRSRLESRLEFYTKLAKVHPDLFRPGPGCAGIGWAAGKTKWPAVGSKALDLHQLFQEVLRHGGSNNVIKNKLWKACGDGLYLPPSCTSMSAKLRKNYHKFLQELEDALRSEVTEAGAQEPDPQTEVSEPATAALAGVKPEPVQTHALSQRPHRQGQSESPASSFIDFGDFIDDISEQEAGAIAMHYNARAMMPQELLAFPEYGYECSPDVRCVFLDIRNHILFKWVSNVRRELLLDQDILVPLMSRFGELPECRPWLDVELIARIFTFLETCGSINCGAFTRAVDTPPRQSAAGHSAQGTKRIVVIGAGFAGLAAATQLKYFGHQVTVLEGRGRVGGRAFTDKSFDGAPVDLGAMLITGGVAHPARLLCDQLGDPMHVVNPTCPLYWSDGRKRARVTDEMDRAVESSFLAATERAVDDKLLLLANTEFPGRVDVEALRKRKEQELASAMQGANPGVASASAATDGSSEEATLMRNLLDVNLKSELASLPQVQPRRALRPLAPAAVDEFGASPQLGSAIAPSVIAASMRTSPPNVLADRAREAVATAKKCVRLAAADAQRVQEGLDRFEGSGRIDEGFRLAQEAITRGVKATAQSLSVVDDIRRMNKSLAPPSLISGRSASETAELSDEAADEVMRKYDVPLQVALDHFLSIQPATEPDQKALLQWHMANLEYACATSLANVSNTHWDQDDEYSFQGPHYLLPRGFGQLAYGLAKPILNEIKFGCTARVIRQTKNEGDKIEGVEIQYEDAEGATQSVDADAVLVTVPLGILQKRELQFSPDLPLWKQGAIDRLGYGNLNKVVVEFPEVFWSKEFDVCGRVVTAQDEPGTRLVIPAKSSPLADYDYEEHRGEFFTFWSLNRCLADNRPILLFLMAGRAAHNVEEADDAVVVESLMLVLRKMFANQDVPDPTRAVVTKWASDPMARGAYSYVAVGATGEEYDLIAEPVNERIFFAGEATSREHPATTGGAMLSGLREACKLATRFGRQIQISQQFPQAQRAAEQLLRSTGNWYGREEVKKLRPTDVFIENVMLKREDGNPIDDEDSDGGGDTAGVRGGALLSGATATALSALLSASSAPMAVPPANGGNTRLARSPSSMVAGAALLLSGEATSSANATTSSTASDN